jgi:hypothetical protein
MNKGRVSARHHLPRLPRLNAIENLAVTRKFDLAVQLKTHFGLFEMRVPMLVARTVFVGTRLWLTDLCSRRSLLYLR